MKNLPHPPKICGTSPHISALPDFSPALKLFANGQVATQYVDLNGVPTMDEYWNPNGSFMAIEGITSPDGRVLGKMAHSERRDRSVAMNIYGEQDIKIFESGVAYFK